MEPIVRDIVPTVSARPRLQILVVKQGFEIVFEIVGAKL